MIKISNLILISHNEQYNEANYVVTTQPGEYVDAKVDVPAEMTKEEIEQIRWVASTVIWDRGPNFTIENLHENASGSRIRVKMHEIYSGGGLAWLEPVFPGEAPTNKTPNGIFVRSTGRKGIAKIEWREYKEKHNGGKATEKFYGQYVELHVYTQGLYGHNLHLRLSDYLYGNKDLTFDEDTDETNNDHLATELIQQVKIYEDAGDPNRKLQKAIFKIYLEHRWMRLAAQYTRGQEIEIGGVLAAEGVKPFHFTDNKDLLRVKKKSPGDTHANPASKEGNKPVVIGNVMTEVAHFNNCRYNGITKTYPGTEEATLFSTKQDINLNRKILDVGVVSTKDSTKKLTISLQEADVSRCHRSNDLHQKETTIDATELQAEYDDVEISEDGTRLSFTPVYPYEHIEPLDDVKFFTTYFPAFLPPEVKFTIPVHSCAFEKEVKIAIHPDVAFALHLHIGKPKDFSGKNKNYYRKINLDSNPQHKLVRGLKKEMKWVREISKEAKIVKRHLPNATLNSIVEEIVYDYIEKTAEDIGVGLHGYHSFGTANQPIIINYAERYEWISKTMIITGVLLSAAVDALIIYITRKPASAVKMTTTWQKVKGAYKIRKRFVSHKKIIEKTLSGKPIDPASPNNIETSFLWPQVSTYRGIGYVDQDNGRVAVELVERIDAAPLFALSHKVTGTLGSVVAGFAGITQVFDRAEQAVGILGYLQGLMGIKKEADGIKKNNTVKVNLSDETKKPHEYVQTGDIQTFLDYIEKKIESKIDKTFKDLFGTEAKMEAEFIGFCSASYEFKVNILKKMMYLDIFEENGRSVQLSDQQELSFGRDKGIDITIALKASSIAEQKWSRLNEYMPRYLGAPFKDTKTEAHINGQVAGTLLYERNFKWKFEAKQPTVQDTILFTGIAGSLYMKLEVEINNRRVFGKKAGSEDKKTGKPKPIKVELIPGFTINFKEQPIFEQSMWDYLMR
ncbi:hypothetical protein [Aquimarina algicola]|uniref:Uncharacterized protein n=1 Tax=Aquimarina algicola TaxID=2589995 RepID=A0A504J5Q7_9FLAO|nr:hypothetical protein [Aquimarina algicola]TPN82963.1 hypothetical protein FHK87_21290 [Aquimarina algicola]